MNKETVTNKCPECGKVPTIRLNYCNNVITCCSITINSGNTCICISKWKKACKLVKPIKGQ